MTLYHIGIINNNNHIFKDAVSRNINTLRRELIEKDTLKDCHHIEIRTEKNRMLGFLILIKFRTDNEPLASVPILKYDRPYSTYVAFRPNGYNGSNLVLIHPYTGEYDKLVPMLDIKDKRIIWKKENRPLNKRTEMHPFGL